MYLFHFSSAIFPILQKKKVWKINQWGTNRTTTDRIKENPFDFLLKLWEKNIYKPTTVDLKKKTET